MKFATIFMICGMVLLGCEGKHAHPDNEDTELRSEKMSINVISPAFKEGEAIPKEHTGEGVDISPQLSWNAVDGVKSYALICDDPDAPRATPWKE